MGRRTKRKTKKELVIKVDHKLIQLTEQYGIYPPGTQKPFDTKIADQLIKENKAIHVSGNIDDTEEVLEVIKEEDTK